MGKKGGKAAREFLVRVPMYCRCIGCRKKLRAAVRGLRQAAGVQAVHQSAAEDTEELLLLATADPKLLQGLVENAMGKKVDLVFPPNKKERPGAGAAAGSSGKEDPRLVDAAAIQGLLADLQRLAPQPRRRHHDGHGAADHQPGFGWNSGAAADLCGNQQQPGLGWNCAAANGSYVPLPAYPWAVSSYYPGPAPASEAYAYPIPASTTPGYCYYPPNAPPWPAGLDY